MERTTPCEHQWAQIYLKDTWSGPLRLSACSQCRAILQEWLPVPIPNEALQAETPGLVGGEPKRADNWPPKAHPTRSR
jgi:hypothetical protein